MKNSKIKKIEPVFCSLDIETSDFDPANCEVLELGMVFFTVQKNAIKISAEWQSTFKAHKEVSPRILALTGIAQEELDASPEFSEKRAEIQQLVNDCVIVGHNINFDIKFLEGFGIKFSGRQIDTLDLAQMFLPTNASYNLEALMNYLEVMHKDAHRALADAKAATTVVETLLKFYATFPLELKRELQLLFPENTFPEMHQLLATKFIASTIVTKSRKFRIAQSPEITEALKENRKIVTFPLGFDYHDYIFGGLQKSKEKVLLVVENKQVVYQLWKHKIAFPLFENRDVFNEKSFSKALKSKLNPEQRFFLGKILVWKYTNWQSNVLCDLNFSYAGNQFRHMVDCSEIKKAQWAADKKEHIIVVDYDQFISSDLDKAFSGRKVIILDMNNFERELTLKVSKKVSWNDFIYTLKQIYDPATEYGKKNLAEIVSDALSQVDLFFGLAAMHWRKIDPESQQFLVSKMAENSNYITIQKVADNFVEKMRLLNKKLQSDKIAEQLQCLELFFVDDASQIRWIEINERRLVFSISPLSLEKIAAEKLEPFKKIIFTASLGSESLIKYFMHRLDLREFGTVKIGQQELRKKFEVIIANKIFSSEDLLKLLDDLEYPAALLLPNSSTLKNFYEANFKTLQQKYKVAAQSYSGGSSKLLDNFGIHENALLLATDHFITKQSAKRVRVRNLIMTRLPFEQFTHPLFAAQAERYPNQFIDFNIPRALNNFHSIIRFFYSQDLEKIYILDQKIHKEYGKYFIDYLKSLPFVDLRRI